MGNDDDRLERMLRLRLKVGFFFLSVTRVSWSPLPLLFLIFEPQVSSHPCPNKETSCQVSNAIGRRFDPAMNVRVFL